MAEVVPKCDLCGTEMQVLFRIDYFCPNECDKPEKRDQIMAEREARKKANDEQLKAWYRSFGFSYPADLADFN